MNIEKDNIRTEGVYNIGQSLWFIENNTILKGVIYEVLIGENSIKFKLYDGLTNKYYIKESKLVSSFERALYLLGEQSINKYKNIKPPLGIKPIEFENNFNTEKRIKDLVSTCSRYIYNTDIQENKKNIIKWLDELKELIEN